MNKQLCIVVGVGEGMGMALARRFGREGYSLALLARNATKLAGYVKELQDAGIAAQAYPTDLAEGLALEQTLTLIEQTQGAASVLIYNASVYREAAPTALAASDLVADFQVNVVSALVAVQVVLPGMRQNKQGSILLTGGGTALEPAAGLASLSIGKAAMRSLALSLFTELAPIGIHAATVTICGMIKQGTKFDPAQIAERFWQLHCEPVGQWQREIVYK